jgi:hypothetical protein
VPPHAAAERLGAVAQAAQARAAVDAGAADAVVAHLEPESPVDDDGAHDGGARPGVLDDVGQRLGDDEVGVRLDGGRQPADADVDRHAHRSARGERLYPRPKSTLRDRGRLDAVGQLAQLADRVLGVRERLGHERFGVTAGAQRALGQLERDDGVDQPLLRAVVQVAHDSRSLALRGVAGALDERRERAQHEHQAEP